MLATSSHHATSHLRIVGDSMTCKSPDPFTASATNKSEKRARKRVRLRETRSIRSRVETAVLL